MKRSFFAALATALEREDWTNQRDRPPFLTWMALSWQARPGAFQRQLKRREEFLQAELAREGATLRAAEDVAADILDAEAAGRLKGNPVLDLREIAAG